MYDALEHEHPMRGGTPRVVSARRARVLRKRGVPLMPLHTVYLNPCDAERGQARAPLTPGNGPGKQSARYAWFEPDYNVEMRQRRRAGRCYNTWGEANRGLRGRKAELDAALRGSREQHMADRYFRQGGKLAATTYYQTFSRCGLYAGKIRENVLQGVLPVGMWPDPSDSLRDPAQLDIYARTWASAQRVDTATGHTLDAIAGYVMPTHWTDAQKRAYILQGYVVEVGDTTPEQRAQRMSPPVTMYYNGGWADNGEPVGVSQHEGETALQCATRVTMAQAERDGLVQRAHAVGTGSDGSGKDAVMPSLAWDGPPYDGVRYAMFPRCASCNGVGCEACGWVRGEGLAR